jgi:hypothetical protein
MREVVNPTVFVNKSTFLRFNLKQLPFTGNCQCAGDNLFYSIGFLMRMQAGKWLFRNCRGETPDTSTGNPMTLFFMNDVEGSNPSALTE